MASLRVQCLYFYWGILMVKLLALIKAPNWDLLMVKFLALYLEM